jgi:hypothetical protein
VSLATPPSILLSLSLSLFNSTHPHERQDDGKCPEL